MRGKLVGAGVVAASAGITPADAGKTCRSWRRRVCSWDHPRGCGENRESLNYATRDIGSPPRMRGKLVTVCPARQNTRITPADAGKTRKEKPIVIADLDHPRGCGENRADRQTAKHWRGSPPRMRGKPSATAVTADELRITPADAGKTLVSIQALFPARDHPRGCGENSIMLCFIDSNVGSPPRMRGKRKKELPDDVNIRITPADAGKT